jgi:hypothetical protein
LASALIRLASTAKPSRPILDAAAQDALEHATEEIACRSLRPFDCTMRMIVCALSISPAHSRTTSLAASGIEPVQDGRIYVELINGAFLYLEARLRNTRPGLSARLPTAGCVDARERYVRAVHRYRRGAVCVKAAAVRQRFSSSESALYKELPPHSS